MTYSFSLRSERLSCRGIVVSGRIGRFYDRFRDRLRRRLLWFCFFGIIVVVRRRRFVRLLDDCLLFGRQHHGHVATFQPSHRLDLAGRANLLDYRIEDSGTELRVGHLSAPELQRDLDLVAVRKEILHVTDLRVEVTLADLRTELDFLDRHLDGLLARFLGLLAFLVPELSVVHDPAHRWVRHGRHLDEIEVLLTGESEGIWQILDSKLAAVCADEANLSGANAIVVPVLRLLRRCYG